MAQISNRARDTHANTCTDTHTDVYAHGTRMGPQPTPPHKRTHMCTACPTYMYTHVHGCVHVQTIFLCMCAHIDAQTCWHACTHIHNTRADAYTHGLSFTHLHPRMSLDGPPRPSLGQRVPSHDKASETCLPAPGKGPHPAPSTITGARQGWPRCHGTRQEVTRGCLAEGPRLLPERSAL